MSQTESDADTEASIDLTSDEWNQIVDNDDHKQFVKQSGAFEDADVREDQLRRLHWTVEFWHNDAGWWYLVSPEGHAVDPETCKTVGSDPEFDSR